MSLTGNNTSLKQAKALKARRMADKSYYKKNSYDLKVAVDSKSPSAEQYWNPKATGGPLLRVVSPFDPAKVLFLRIVNHTMHDPVPVPGNITITAQLNDSDFSKRPDNQAMPNDLPEGGPDGIGFIMQTKPLDPTPDADTSSNPQDMFRGRSTDQPVNKQHVTDGGSMINQHQSGVNLVGADGKGLHMNPGGIYMDKPIDSTELKSTGMLLKSPVNDWIGMPETIVTIPSWNKWPDVAKIIDWANVAGYAFQAISKIKRSKEALDEA